jgi:hypothetical protein
MRHVLLLTAVLGLLGVSAGAALAADPPLAPAPQRGGAPNRVGAPGRAGEGGGLPLWMREPRWRFDGRVATTGFLPAAFDAGGRVASYFHAASLAADRALWKGARLTLRASYELRRYDFGAGNPLFPTLRQPFRDIQTIGAGATLFQALSESWAVLLTTTVTSSVEVGADLDRGLALSVVGGVGHRFSDALTLGVGAIYVVRFAEQPIFFPGPQFDWRIDERWRLALDGAELTLGHRFSPRHDLALKAAFDSRRFRLDRGAPKNGHVAGDSRGLGALVYTFSPDENVELSLSVGLGLFRQMWVEEPAGDRVYDLSPDISIGAAIRVRF